MNAHHDNHIGTDVRRRAETPRGGTPLPATVPYRLSDVERDEASAALGEAYAEGRLDHDEFEVRLETAARAVFATDLDPLFADLPQSRTVRARFASMPRPPAPARGPAHRPPMFGFLLLLLALAVLTHAWLLIPLAFVILGHRRRTWAPWSPDAVHAVGCRPHAGGQRSVWR